MCTKNLDDMIYRSWEIERDRLKLVILGHVLPFYPLKNPKNQNFEKMKKNNTAEDIIILYMCTKNDNHIMYDSWDTEWDRGNFLSFWTIFCPFTPLAICQNKKAAGDIIGLHKCTINDSHIMYGSWEMEHDGQNLFKFWTIFYPLTTWKSKILKKWKKAKRYYHFAQVYQKTWLYTTLFLRYSA